MCILNLLIYVKLLKKDTSGGFTPILPGGDAIAGPNRACLRLDGQLDRATLGPQIHRAILTMARLRNIVSSLRQEGVQVDFAAARDVLDGQAPTRASEVEVLRFATEYARIHEAAQLPALTVNAVLELHGRLFHGYDEVDYRPGRLKTAQNGIGLTGGGSDMWHFECTPPERTHAELEALVTWYDANRSSEPAISVAAVFFAELQGIHPFHNGNGRLGRVLNTWVLKDLGFANIGLVPLDARFFRTTDSYYDRIRSTNTGTTWGPWGNYFAQETRKAYEAAVGMSDLSNLVKAQPTDSARHVLTWAIRRGDDWFARKQIPLEGYQPGTISVALRALVDGNVFTTNGKTRKGTKYRLRTDLLQDIFRGAL
jgi:Fic family protein